VSFGADGPRTEVSIDRIQFGGPDASPYVVPKFHNLPRSANRPGGRRTSSPRSPPRSSAVGVAASEPRFSMWHFLLTLCATCCALIPSTRADPQLPVPVSFRPSDRVELNFVPLVQAMAPPDEMELDPVVPFEVPGPVDSSPPATHISRFFVAPQRLDHCAICSIVVLPADNVSTSIPVASDRSPSDGVDPAFGAYFAFYFIIVCLFFDCI